MARPGSGPRCSLRSRCIPAEMREQPQEERSAKTRSKRREREGAPHTELRTGKRRAKTCRVRKSIRAPAAIAVFALAIACKQMPGQADAAQSAGGGADKATLVIAASVAGQLVPCGCSPDQRGGVSPPPFLPEKTPAPGAGPLFLAARGLLFGIAAKTARPPPPPGQAQARGPP